ncbi:MAG: glycosyltransferase family 4 protein [Planctomycetota bacterium]
MSGTRVVMVTRRFWPLMGGSESVTAGLGRELMERGLVPSFLTARFDMRWPSDVVFQEMAVHRLAFPQQVGWGPLRYGIVLARWLRRHQNEIDLACVSGLSLEAHAAIKALAGTRIPVVLRAESDAPRLAEGTSPEHRVARQVARHGRTDVAVVVSSEAARQRLIDAGFSGRHLRLVPDGIALKESGWGTDTLSARSALAGANEDLRVGLYMTVVTYVGPLQAEYKLDQLIWAWQRVAGSFPHARLWLIGDGPCRNQLYRMVQDADLVGRVVMPGTFDNLEDIMRASDLLVVPSGAIDQSPTILTAMAKRVSVLVAKSPEHASVVRDGVTGRLLAQTNSNALADAISGALADPRDGEDMAAAAFGFVHQYHSRRAMGQQYHDLFEHLTGASRKVVP